MKANNSFDGINRYCTKNTLAKLCIGIFEEVIYYLLSGNYSSIPIPLIAAFELFILKDVAKDMSIYHHCKKISNSEEYQELVDLYDTYITYLADFLKSIDISESMDVAFAYKALLSHGMLSTEKYNYHIFKNDKFDKISEIYGSRVFTGKAVCRHISSFLTDLINKMDGCAANVICNVYNTKEFSESKNKIIKDFKKNKIVPRHMVTGFLCDGKKVFVDNTSSSINIYRLDDELNEKECFGSCLYDGFFYDSILLFDNIQLKIDRFNYNNPDNLKRIMTSPDKKFEGEELLDSLFNIRMKIIKNIDEVIDFHRSNEDIIYRIAELNEIITPHNDKGKIKVKKALIEN